MRGGAGPQRDLPGGEFWTYVRSVPAGGLNLNLPAPLPGGVSFSPAGDCRVTFQLVEGRVRRIGYSGASEFDSGTSGTCAPIVHGCLSALRAGEIGPVVATPAATATPPAPPPEGGAAAGQGPGPTAVPSPDDPGGLHRTRP